MPNTATILSVREVHKKFTKDIKHNMYYGILDILSKMGLGRQEYLQLRKKEFWALHDINLELKEGEILGIVGSNGSGKTTLMRLISGIYPMEMGEIDGRTGQKITSVFALRAGMQPLFTGLENIYIKGSMYGMSKEEVDHKMDFIREFSELGDHLQSPFGNYSSGMRARLAYAIALATEPDVFIIDEALAVGDSVFKAKCFDNLKEFVKGPNRGVLFVSNNIRKILKVATRVLVMEKGRIIHNSTDVRDALVFYIRNCLKHLDEEQIERELKKIQDYDM